MTQTTPTITRLPLGQRILYGTPLIGRIAREVSQDVNNVFYLLVVVITLEILAFLTWGPVVFTLTALVLVPLMFLFFIAISWPGRSRPKS
ncbi:hypothetical protein EEB11_13890 [Pseudotabrizicola sediminis]|uniref:Uncharacterized protein n=1 Tax=Pseudotabrizicola sediminis TaxID=2486418 RepID=A0ABY2KIZ9_9RHOB|nr:hypothetical protein [Pseudotabrizicola sediminis]TGD42375.1 hypothetical protein EEB11_13890 [Pseudotabrizicola sediminis]TGD65096.1 hypothetical protein EYC08_08390 [Tabrizicola sp. WMC-M-20]